MTDGADSIQGVLDEAIDFVHRGQRQSADEAFASITTRMLGEKEREDRVAIAEMVASRLGKEEFFELQRPFQQFLARLAPDFREAAKWVAAEGDVLAKKGSKAAAAARCCIARTLARDGDLPEKELVFGTLGVAGLCRDAMAIDNPLLWQELMDSLSLPFDWFDLYLDSEAAVPWREHYRRVQYPKLPKILAQMDEALNLGAELRLIERQYQAKEEPFLPLRSSLSLMEVEIGNQRWSQFYFSQGILRWLGDLSELQETT